MSEPPPESPVDPVRAFACRNPACADYGERGRGNLYFRGWSGRGKRARMVYCRTCKTSSSERKGTALERSRLPPEKVAGILAWARAGCGVRATSRFTGVSRDAVSRHLARDRARAATGWA